MPFMMAATAAKQIQTQKMNTGGHRLWSQSAFGWTSRLTTELLLWRLLSYRYQPDLKAFLVSLAKFRKSKPLTLRMTLKKRKALLSDCCKFLSQQNSVKHVVTSAACWELSQVPARADLCDRWSYWNGILPGLTGRNQRVTGIPPFPSRCVVGSGPCHCIYILCMLRLCCLLEIVNSGGMLRGHWWAPGPQEKCMRS